MATLRGNTRNNVIAGLFLLVSLLVAIVISVVLSDGAGILHERATYTLRIDLERGAAGLESGSDVMLGGRPIGQVGELSIAEDDSVDPPRPVGVDVKIRVRADIAIYENATAIIRTPLLGTLSKVDFVSVGDPAGVENPRGSGPLLEAGEVLEISAGAPMLLAQLGLGSEDAEGIREMIRDAREAVDRASSLIETLETAVEEDQAILKSTLEDARAMIAEFREKTPGWTERVDSILANADSATAEFDGLGADAREAVEEVRVFLDDLDAVVRENGPKIDEAMDNALAFSEELNEIDIAAVNRAVRDISEGAERITSFIDRIDTVLKTESPTLSRILANAAIASDQLKLATIEVRRAPWRLLYTPRDKELENQLLYDTAGAYANAVGDLRTASEALRAAAEGDPATLAVNEREIERIVEHLREAFETYEQAEREFLEQLLGR